MKANKLSSSLIFIVILSCILIFSSCDKPSEKTKQLSEVEQKFDSVFVKTLDGKQFALTKYIDSLSKDKPLVITTTFLFCGGCNSSIKKVAEYQKQHPEFEVIALSIDQLTEKSNENTANTEEDLVDKLKKLDLGTHVLYNIDTTYIKKVLDGRAYTPQTYIINNDSIVYYNNAGEYLHFQDEHYLVINALKSQNEKVIDTLKESDWSADLGQHETKLIHGFDNFKRIGKWERLANNNTKWKGEFLGGKKSGEWKHNHDNGTLQQIGIYENGEKTGKWKSYHKNGQLSSIIDYKDDKKTGEVKYYHDNGKLKAVGNFAEDKMIGEWKYYHINGKLNAIGIIEDNKQIGEWKIYHDNGKLQSIGNYEDSKQTGEWKYYFENEKLQSVGIYKDGKVDGEWKKYHDNEQLYQLRLWEDGKLMDIISCFDRNGTPVDKGTIVNGNGTVKNYDANGKVTSVQTYKDGILVE